MDRTGDERAMRAALALAARGPAVDPNPRVGAVVTDPAGRVVGRGYHRGAGSPHAEVEALAQAGAAASGGTAYVTLEPCDHTGRTGPCSQALVAAGVARVVFAQTDPHDAAAGGARTLQAAGVQVEGGLLVEQATALNRSWTAAVTAGRPRVVWKYAGTLDGRSAAADGTSRWITGPEARADVHRLRAEAGAVVVGTGTVLADDPSLTVRGPDDVPTGRQPLRVVVGRRDLPAGARVLDAAAETLQLRTHDPEQVLAVLHARGIRTVWLEGGPTLAAAFLAAGLVDEVVAYLAPTLLGAGPAVVADLGIGSLAGALQLHPTDVTVLGPDLRVRATTVHPPEGA
ncbi:bifunctional diaminohydroxyphosphoribosylaminopyrimidine deaminase/5-amino-6-(5-phosphoribosylamino)uracil reductase RibD [Auraticoccus sp. F435]|uniref:Riboflavin biosynthesis protein RibD n=1 Tax=Auraticoccus cholistanensis TaxID=2656650 RepID=A0A6A9V105_9ACTN|nr:bifunctional diaminohydroxyphosphoribosylaminopyrimidine deaminase/5-amino-6-(5-phosphoribosylamino)uracil reductase RibD [Auraticoccus cholistanensis]MVA76260.1 bifunctional diaminohydroxyphosphoribosylaminopyrimidine deaminase/5-amino-6-(5-phosphoribosylamino)uracil reductase RibD [Auraticoccus cholistanensis]